MTDNLARAQRHYDAIEPEDFPILDDKLELTLSQQIVAWMLAGGDAQIAADRLKGLADFLIDEFGLDAIDSARVLPTDPTALQTLQKWIDAGTGPRDFDLNDFDCRR